MSEEVRYTYINEDLDSSALEALWYDVFQRRLYVEFPSGQIAGYLNVPAEVVEELENANSVGAYFSKNVKGVYHGTSGDVDLVAFDYTSDTNLYAATVPSGAPVKEPIDHQEAMLSEYSEITDNHNEGTYAIEFVIEAKTEFKAPAGNILEALNLFVGAFSEGNKDAHVRVRSIKEIG